MFYGIQIIFNNWKGYINKYIVKICKCINILDELSYTYINNNIKDNSKLLIYLIKEHKVLKMEYLNTKKIKSKKKLLLINDYNKILSIIENEHKIYMNKYLK